MRQKKHFEKIIALLTLACVFAFSGGTAYAADETALPDGFVIADADGIRASKDDGGYMITVSDIEPGDVITKIITLRNLEVGDEPYDLFMTAEPLETTGPVNLAGHSRMSVELDGTVIYTGPVDEFAGGELQNKAVGLGTYGSGDTKVAKITITIDNDWMIGYSKSKTTFFWSFYANKSVQPILPKPGDTPKTGEIIKYVFYILCSLMLAALCILYIVYKRRTKSTNAAGERG